MSYLDPTPDWEKIRRRLPEFLILSEFDELIRPNLVETNVGVIRKALELKGMSDGKLSLESSSRSRGTQRIIDLCLMHGAKTYLSGPSGRNYLDMPAFKENNIQLEFIEDSTPKKTLVDWISE